jgi:hypothetical protein
MKFKKNKYLVIKKIIPTDFANFLYNYSFLKKKVADKMFQDRYLSPYIEYLHFQKSGVFGTINKFLILIPITQIWLWKLYL